MVQRNARGLLKELQKGYPAIAITGPRQSGKTTLAKSFFKHLPYLSFENPDILLAAREDPRSFLDRHITGAVLDEVQRSPELVSYLQQIIDEGPGKCRFVLTGSQQFGLHSNITQSLAGRCALLHLLPFSIDELYGRRPFPDLETVLFRGLYPPVHNRKLNPTLWYANYVQTYIERDVRQLVNVKDLGAFRTFLLMCAARSGHLLNLSGLASDCGITHNTARSWFSILEASYILFALRPFHSNFGKRLVKTPKVYFYDTGLLAYLMDIRSKDQIAVHPCRGALFETFVIAEIAKASYNRGLPPPIYFWRDRKGFEVDLLVEQGGQIWPIEIKAGKTIARDWVAGPTKWTEQAGSRAASPQVIYGGDEPVSMGNCAVWSWRKIASFGALSPETAHRDH